MRLTWLPRLVVAILMGASPAYASDQPIYQAAPAWIVPTQLPQSLLSAAGAPGPYFDFQERFEDGREWSYLDAAIRINSPEDLGQNDVLKLPWFPDKGDLIIHELTIIRGNQQIDLIAKGQRFTVLRREEALEQRELTGILTATLAVEGLQVGDILRLRASITKKDPALGGRTQWISPIVALPKRLSAASLRLSWPVTQPVQWKMLGYSVESRQVRDGKYQVLTLTLPAPKQPEMPPDAPVRYQHPPLIETSSFADWRDVSKVMSPLYDTAHAIPASSPLTAEVSRLMLAETDPAKRAALALRSVQDNVRYLAVGMDGGNYIPQTPEKTWSVRYGDCKAKTLLLLAMLHAMGIEAEPVLASIGLDGLVPEGVPSAAAFNHVFVRARIGGVSYWLDGTGSGTRFADLGDTPPVHNVLPLRADGAELEIIPWHAPARPNLDMDLAIDESASVDLPSVIDATLTVRGERANMLTLVSNQLGPKEKNDFLGQILSAQLGEGQVKGASMSIDPDAGTVTVKGRFVGSTAWRTQDRRSKRKLSFAADQITFAPDRSRAAWNTIPVSTGLPDRSHYKVRIRLPEQGRGFALEGNTGVGADKVAGYNVERTVALTSGSVELDEMMTCDGSEVPASAIPLERSRLAKAQAQLPRVIAPIDTRRRWELAGTDPVGASQAKAIEEVFAATIAAADPDDVSGLTSRANYRRGIGDFKGALEDLRLIIAKQPSVENYAAHGGLAIQVGDMATALADGEAALKLEPNSVAAIGLVAQAEADRGNMPHALTLLDERIALGGEDRADMVLAKAALIGEYGDPHEALKLLDDLIVEKPGNPAILNSMCWIKATRAIDLDSALKNCTSAIELASDTAPFLDSRAVVWFRLGRYDDALRDADAALLQTPSLGPTRFMRGLILKKLGRTEEAARELTLARRLAPGVEKEYARYGLKP